MNASTTSVREADVQAQTLGRWEVLPYKSQIEAVHMALTHTGKVIYYSGYRVAEAKDTETRLWYPAMGEIRTVPTPNDLFCAGHSFLPDGRLLSCGGTLEYRNLPKVPPWLVRLLRPLTPLLVRFRGVLRTQPSFTGPTYLYLFDPRTERWTFAAEMAGGRWYPTNTTLPDGRILLISGNDEGHGFGTEGDIQTNMRLEVYGPETGVEHVATIPHGDAADGHEHHAFPSLYPRMHVLPLPESVRQAYPNGRVFCSGYGPPTKMLNLKTWEWTHVADLNFGERHDGCSVLMPLHPPDYRARILTFGGSLEGGDKANATDTAEIIDFGQERPAWKNIDPLPDRRSNGSAVLLADGKTLAVGGNNSGRFDDPVYDTTAYDPEENRWIPLARSSVPRGYHSTAVLLPDGRVLSSGTTPYGQYELRMEVYTPYYLFRGERPVVTKAPKAVCYGASFEISYRVGGHIKTVAMIRPGATTHAFDMDQRYVVLNFEPEGAGRLRAQAPPDAHVAPPGYYMLVLLTEQGVPSEAVFVQLTLPAS